jgi:lysophospholipid acyltransferase (LPLAT)-like uncharacterized protein
MRVVLCLLRMLSATLRLKASDACWAKLKHLGEAPGLVVLWHNRLFMAPKLLRSYGVCGQMAAVVSASQDGAWVTTGLNLFGIQPIRGSRHRRGREALREMVAERQAGKSIILTPDGSRGPMYEMKPGAALLARETESVVYLVSVNYTRTWRLETWDRFFVPWPFSLAQIKVREIAAQTLTAAASLEDATSILKAEMDAITED